MAGDVGREEKKKTKGKKVGQSEKKIKLEKKTEAAVESISRTKSGAAPAPLGLAGSGNSR
jgi:hypothetical protein